MQRNISETGLTRDIPIYKGSQQRIQQHESPPRDTRIQYDARPQIIRQVSNEWDDASYHGN